MEIDTIEETELDAEITSEPGMDAGITSESEKMNEIPRDIKNRIQFYVQRIKLAVAFAIIKSTPVNMTPEKYALHLMQSFTDDTHKWKIKYETLEREVIALEEKLETVALREKFNIPDGNLNLLMNENSFDHISQPRVFSTSDLNSKICNTLEFVRCFIFLGSHFQDSFENNRSVSNEKLGERILCSISRLFEYLRSNEGLNMEFEVIRSAMHEVRRLFDSKANIFENSLIKISLMFVDNLLIDIYKTLEINMVEYQHRRSALIQMIAEQRKLTTVILSRLLREITIISDSLVTALHSPVEDVTPLLRVENAYYVLQATEGILHILRQQGSALIMLKISKSLLAEWSKTTAKSLLEIGTNFSMYSIYIWHIKTLLESVFDSSIEN